MNTGEKNVKGRTIYRGPRGGMYVVTSGGSKLSKFTRAPPPPAPVPTSPNVPGFTKTNYVNIYKKVSSGRYYLKNAAGKLHAIGMTRPVRHKSTGITASIKEHIKPTATATPRRRKTAPAPAPTHAPVLMSPVEKLPSPSPRPVITTAERNRRLAEIRRRLEAIREGIRAAKPKTRKNVEAKLRLAYWRVRARRSSTRDSLAGAPHRRLAVRFKHWTAAVPRSRARTAERTVDFPVYTGTNPLINSGGVVAMHERDFDLDWFRRQSEYISKLSDYDFWTVQAHTNRSHSWIGPYTYRKNIPTFRALGSSVHITPLWPQVRKMILGGKYDAHGWVNDFKRETNEKNRYDLYTRHVSSLPSAVKQQALDMYIKDLKRIITGAPKTKKKMILYRGTGFDIFQGTTGHWYKLKSFCSAAYNVSWSAGYGHMMHRITVLPGTPVLLAACTNQWAHSGEYEVMVNIDTQYLIRSRGVKRHSYYDGRKQGNFTVTDVIIAK